MKDKIIETAGKTWRFLGQHGQTSVNDLTKALKEKDEVVLQAVGWLAREDKINYTTKNRRTFVALVDHEVSAFNHLMYNMNDQIAQETAGTVKAKGKGKK